MPAVFRSLRFKLPALFLLGILLSGLVASLIALRLFQDYTRDQSIKELRQEALGLSQLYAAAAVRASDEGRKAPDFAAAQLGLRLRDHERADRRRLRRQPERRRHGHEGAVVAGRAELEHARAVVRQLLPDHVLAERLQA